MVRALYISGSDPFLPVHVCLVVLMYYVRFKKAPLDQILLSVYHRSIAPINLMVSSNIKLFWTSDFKKENMSTPSHTGIFGINTIQRLILPII